MMQIQYFDDENAAQVAWAGALPNAWLFVADGGGEALDCRDSAVPAQFVGKSTAKLWCLITRAEPIQAGDA